MVSLVIPCFNRSNYLAQCLASLDSLTTWPDMIVFVNDGSDDFEVVKILQSFTKKHHSDSLTIITSMSSQNRGVKYSLKEGIECSISEGATTIINLDSDAIVTPDFVERLVKLKEKFWNYIVTGFNHVSEANYVIDESNDCVLKKHINGINMCFDVSQYHQYIKPSLEVQGNWDYGVSTSGVSRLGFVASKPSCVQHIGMVSSMGHSGNGQVPDVAQDFPAEYMPLSGPAKVKARIHSEVKDGIIREWQDAESVEYRGHECHKSLCLPNVTLFGIDAHNPNGINRAAEICERNIHFGAVKIITERLFPGATMKEGRENYSRFIIKELYKHFETSHVLIIHSDGYVQNWEAWKDEWLQYDLIGATWSYKDGKNVGNGGFSLRSQRLCHILAIDENIKDLHPEDDRIARQYRPYLEEKYGIKFAPEEVANQFSIEAYGSHVFTDSSGINAAQYSNQFGFHGNHVRGLKTPLR